MSTVASRRLDALLDAAEASGSCLVAHEERDRRALRRRLGMPNSDLLSPAPGLYVRRDHWLGLRPNERALHVMRGLAERRPGIVFCAQSAALAWGLPVSWHLLKETHVACQRKSGLHSTPQVVAHQISHDSPDVAGGLPVTSFWRTVFDCLRLQTPSPSRTPRWPSCTTQGRTWRRFCGSASRAVPESRAPPPSASGRSPRRRAAASQLPGQT